MVSSFHLTGSDGYTDAPKDAEGRKKRGRSLLCTNDPPNPVLQENGVEIDEESQLEVRDLEVSVDLRFMQR
jgi:hypothetical protein